MSSLEGSFSPCPVQQKFHNHHYANLDFSLMDEIFDLVEGGHVGPVHPITTYSFDSVIPALSYMRRGQHIGKIVISSEKEDVQLPIRPAVRKLQLQSDASYLIVGGLKGLCGSVAVHLARHGARHIIVMSRSGTNDEASARIIDNCAAYDCKITEAKGDAGDMEFVHGVFKSAHPKRIAGVIQGAMVLRVGFPIAMRLACANIQCRTDHLRP